MLKHINIPFKRNVSTIKALNIGLFRPAIRNDVSKNRIKSSYVNFIKIRSPLGRKSNINSDLSRVPHTVLILGCTVFYSAAHHALLS